MYQHPGKRPVYLSLTRFHFPLNAWLSIGHRLSGVALFISLIGYLGLLNLIVWHDLVSLASVREHWITKNVHTAFWIGASFHWLSGVRHLLAEHFTQPHLYELINCRTTSLLLLATWFLASFLITYKVWSS